MINTYPSNLPQPQARTTVPALDRSGAAARPADVPVTPAADASRGNGSGRPVRISRHPEEAALFAYNRQAQLNTNQVRPQIDEYV